MEHELVTATDLEKWADRRVSQSDFPKLVRRLVFATSKKLIKIDFRAGEGVSLGGFDGVVYAEESDPFVPKGRSIWEMGVGDQPKTKADDDFNKRTAQVSKSERSDTVFVFVTPRRWYQKDKWVTEKKELNQWKDVRVYDADKLETWLERSPAVHLWISEELGRDPFEARSLESWWESWSKSTNPAIPNTLVLSGRENECKKIQEALESGLGSLSFCGDSQDEVLAFIACSILTSGSSKAEDHLRRALVVRTSKAWNRLLLTETPLILLPVFERPDVSKAVGKGHQVILPIGPEAQAGSAQELPRLCRKGIEAALVEAQVPPTQASELATLGRRSLMALRRKLAVFRELQQPGWARPEHAREIVPALLMGRWIEDHDGDRKALEKISGTSFASYTGKLIRWLNTSDAPIRRTGRLWSISSRQDSWMLLAQFITKDDLNSFREISIEILGAHNPALDLPREERYLAAVIGKTPVYSGEITEGVADMVAMMAMAGECPLANDIQTEARRIVFTLLDECNKDHTGRRWCSIAAVLPLLSEAAPEIFLEAVEAALSDDQAVLVHMFQDSKAGLLSSHSDHTYLLWALEGLAWSSAYFPRVLSVLAKLAEIDPGGRLDNRPINSLVAILLLWYRSSTASIDQKLRGIDRLRKDHPEIAWGVMLRLIPSGHDIASPTHSPRWRRTWKPDEPLPVTYADLDRALSEIVARALQDVGSDGKRWMKLLGRLDRVPQGAQSEILDRLNRLEVISLDTTSRRNILEALRQLVHRRRDAESEEDLPSNELNQLENQIQRFESGTQSEKHEWLFRNEALFQFRSNSGSFDSVAHVRAQVEAMTKIYESEGMVGILVWSELFAEKNPYDIHHIGWALGKIKIAYSDENQLLDELTSTNPIRRTLSAAFARSRSVSGDVLDFEWIRSVLASRRESWDHAHSAAFLVPITSFPAVWSLARELGTEIERGYWAQMSYYGLPQQDDSCLVAARKLFEFGRSYDALALLDLYSSKLTDGMPLEFSAQLLEAILKNPPAAPDQMFSYHIGNHLDRLQQAQFDEKRLAILEWHYLPLFEFEGRKSGVLQKNLSKDPEFFVSIITLVYKARNGEARVLSPEDRARARIAYQLLKSWRIIPGSRDDGSIDGDFLNNWVARSRALLSQVDRIETGEQEIGKVLRYGPEPVGDSWPAAEIKNLVEDVASSDLEQGLYLEVYNSRGATSRSLTDGGRLEREEAAPYLRYAKAAEDTWPRTAALLRSIADTLQREAKMNDLRSEVTEDQWS